MSSVTFTCAMLENARKVPEVYRRLTRGSWCRFSVAGGAILGALAGLTLAALIAPSDWPVFLLASMYTGYAIGLFACRSCSLRALGKGLKARGMPERLTYVVEAAPDALSWTGDRVSGNARWPAVTELDRLGTDWLFLCDNFGLFVPSAAFGSAEAERAFVGDALGFMSEEARARSPRAAAFAGAVS